MKKIIDKWKHIPGVHCGSAALRDVAQYFGFDFSEELCFGLGGGLGFYYSVDDEMSPTRAIHVRGPGMEANFLRRFDIEVDDWKHENDNDRAFETLKDFIDRDIPVLIQTDIFYLDYYNSSTHFPGHIIVVCGYDDEKREFLVSDTGFTDNQPVSYENLKKARISKARPYPLQNNWFEADLGNREIDMGISALDSIVTNAREMLDGVETLRGESGVERIKAWADDLPSWTEADDWKWCSRFAYQVISKRGTEGAAFRHMYRDFLKEVSEDITELRDSGLIGEIDDIGNMWINISDGLKITSELDYPGDNFVKLAGDINRLYEREKMFYSDVVRKLDHRS